MGSSATTPALIINNGSLVPGIWQGVYFCEFDSPRTRKFYVKVKHKSFSDSIGIISNLRKRGPVYELPVSVLYGNVVKNLTVAGRCISVTDAMWDVSRVIPACAVTGEAAGTIAAMTDDISAFDVSLIQIELLRKNVKIKIDDL